MSVVGGSHNPSGAGGETERMTRRSCARAVFESMS
jgi:hypothetical protein